MTRVDAARRGEITPQIAQVDKDEFRDPEFVREGVAAGRIAIPANINHPNLRARGVGEGLRTRVNVNLGISGDIQDAPREWEKVAIAEKVRCGRHHGPFQLRQDARVPPPAH